MKGIVLDPFNEIEHNFGNLTETQYISKTLTKIRSFARHHDVHIWQIAHPTKIRKEPDVDNYRVPTLYDINGGANWRNKADNGIIVYRPDFKVDKTEVHIQKIRFRDIGRTGAVKFNYDRDTGIYTDQAYDFNYGGN